MREGGRMFRYYECEKCGRKFFPPKFRCFCGSTKFREVTVERAVGKILTYTIILVPPKGFTPPIYIGIAEFNGMKILGRYEGDPQSLSTGMLVELSNENGTTVFRGLKELSSHSQ
ncbi:MAG: hypothetical protein QXK31_06515 [Fervidicoccaceae archaeon]